MHSILVSSSRTTRAWPDHPTLTDLAVEPERKDRLLKQALLERRLKGREHLVHGNLGERQALQRLGWSHDWRCFDRRKRGSHAATRTQHTLLHAPPHTHIEQPSHTAHHDAIKLGHDEAQGGLLHRLGKGLLPDDQVAQRDRVLGQKARQGAGPILDGKVAAVLLRVWHGQASEI